MLEPPPVRMWAIRRGCKRGGRAALTSGSVAAYGSMPRRRPDPLDRLSIGHYMMRRWSLEDDVRELERLRFRSISLASTKVEAYGAARTVALLRRSSLRVAHVGSYGRFGTTRASMRTGLEQVRRALDWVHELGANVLVVIPGGRDGADWARAAARY